MSSPKAAAAAGSMSSHWLANAADLSPSVLDRVWVSRALLTLETVAVPLAFWFKPLCVFVALFWLFYRASQVLNKPLDELSSLLGCDIPSTPIIDLASIKADGAIVHWSLPEKPKHKSQLKYEIHLNGNVIDTVSVHESAVTISGLQAEAFYVVRVALLHNEFSSKSPAIRFRTKPAASNDFFHNPADGNETDQDMSEASVPRIRPYRALKDITPASPTSAAMARESSSGLGRNNGRRLSPAAVDYKQDSPPEETDVPKDTKTVQQLTERLDAIRRETEEAERLAKEEDEEEIRVKEELVKERDELKLESNEKEKASRNLKREVNTLERQNTAAQNERAKQERLLQQKKQERQKLKDDMVRWERGAQEMSDDVERIQQEKANHLEKTAQERESLREKHAEESAKTRTLDDDVKEKTAEMKKLERSMKTGSPKSGETEPNLVQQLQSDAEEERRWQALRHGLQQQYQMAFNKVDAAKRFYGEQMRYLESLRAERRRQDEMTQIASPTLDRIPRRGDSQRSRHAQSRHSISDSPRMGTFPVNPSSFAGNMNTVPPAFNSSSFFNIQNGMTLAHPTDEVAMSDEDRDRLTGGAPMSPGSGAELIPADLFSGDGDTRPSEYVQPLPGLGSLPGLPGLPGPLPPSAQHDATGPGSPAASSSRSPSVFTSPQASQPNLHISSPNEMMDADRRSIRSTRSTRAPSGGASSRFSGMFGIKPRNKNMAEEGPPLSKASSMPRQDPGILGLDSATRKRNSSMSSSVFGPLEAGLDGSAEAQAPGPGRRAFGIFSKDKSGGDKTGGWPSTFTTFSRRPASPRPVSTHSNELPRPPMDGSRWGVDTWPSADATSGARGSPLAFGSGWNAPSQQPRMYGSRHPSRRQSMQYGAGPPEDILEDEDSDALDSNSVPQLAPIGTKPSKKADNAAKLNPNAKDFKSFFSSMKFGGKDKGKDSGDSGDKDDGATPGPSTSATPNLIGMENDDSPPNSRKSRDTRSITTAESSQVESQVESGRNSPDLVRTPSYSNSELAPGPSPSLQSRESFMQKITRKSSSSKFSLPTFKRANSRLDPSTASNTSTPVPAEDEEDEMSASVGSLKEIRPNMEKEPRESKDGSRSSRSWSSAFKLGKKKGIETQSLSDRVSTTSGTEDGEGGDEEDEM